ncbi:MAG: hypothetical protein K2M17_03340 [Bacilli bacterium]|nr:hypothetical protein [Bacilli bacterium]
MKIYNLKRGGGKTTRLLCISEYTNTPILCIDQTHKNLIKNQARKFDMKIPEPITISELESVYGSDIESDYIVDEAIAYLQAIILRLSAGKPFNPIAISFSENE